MSSRHRYGPLLSRHYRCHAASRWLGDSAVRSALTPKAALKASKHPNNRPTVPSTLSVCKKHYERAVTIARGCQRNCGSQCSFFSFEHAVVLDVHRPNTGDILMPCVAVSKQDGEELRRLQKLDVTIESESRRAGVERMFLTLPHDGRGNPHDTKVWRQAAVAALAALTALTGGRLRKNAECGKVQAG
eukprot:m.24705 g.24705  ORF g.24705 m.24705 type:complete len:188 (-) comp7577_c0_seq1:108-671(-)